MAGIFEDKSFAFPCENISAVLSQSVIHRSFFMTITIIIIIIY